MAVEITLTPTLEDNGNGIPTTKIGVYVDVSSIQEGLKIYDLLLKTTLRVMANPGNIKVYEYAKIYKDIKTNTIKFETLVIGMIGIEDIKCEAIGVFVDK